MIAGGTVVEALMRMDTMTGVEVACWLFGGLFLIFGVAFRTGLIHGDLARLYRDPAIQANGLFALIPIGIGWCAAAALPPTVDVLPFGVTLGIVAVWWAGWIFGLVVLVRPPWWMKPRWVRDAEADGWRNYERPAFPTGLRLLMATAIVVVLGAGVVVMLSHATTLELVGAILTGLGVAGFYLRRGDRADRLWVLSRDWRAWMVARETAAAAESEREHRELLHRLPPRDVINDPKSRLVLRRSGAEVAWMSLAVSLFILVFAVEVLWLAFLGHPPIVQDVLFALLCFPVAAAGVVGWTMTATSRLELTPGGFRIRRLEDQFVWWIDVKDIRATAPTTGIRNQPMVAVRLTPAGRARARPGVVRFFGVDPLRIPSFGMGCDAQATLMEQWRQRWTAWPWSLSSAGGPRL